jgi:hypothetical protein
MEPLCRELKGNADAVEFCNIPPYLDLLIAASYICKKVQSLSVLVAFMFSLW